jgi:hypothetical protein
MARLRRTLSLLATLTIILTGFAVPAAHASAEGAFVAKINAERVAQGLEPVEVYWDLADDARAHSQHMLEQGALYHNPELGSVCGSWIGLGENVGVGPTADSIHNAFMSSPGHRANVLGDYNYIGVGVVRESPDEMWVTVVFMKGPPGLVTPPQPDPQPDPVPDPQPDPVPDPQPDPEPDPVPEPAAPATATATAEPGADEPSRPVSSFVREPIVRYARIPGLHPTSD